MVAEMMWRDLIINWILKVELLVLDKWLLKKRQECLQSFWPEQLSLDVTGNRENCINHLAIKVSSMKSINNQLIIPLLFHVQSFYRKKYCGHEGESNPRGYEWSGPIISWPHLLLFTWPSASMSCIKHLNTQSSLSSVT